MVNSYEPMKSGDIIIDDPMPRQQLAKQQEFLRRNHHCISPWMYTPLQIQQRNHALFLMEFDRAQKARKYETIPMATSPEIAEAYAPLLEAAMEPT